MPGNITSGGFWPGAVYRIRDAFENLRGVPRNSPVSNVIHLGMGFAGMGAAALGASTIDSQADRSAALAKMDAMALPVATSSVFITAGMQFMTKHRTGTLPRGLNPIYFLTVGAYAANETMTKNLREGMER
jgi:hypothetical protein